MIGCLCVLAVTAVNVNSPGSSNWPRTALAVGPAGQAAFSPVYHAKGVHGGLTEAAEVKGRESLADVRQVQAHEAAHALNASVAYSPDADVVCTGTSDCQPWAADLWKAADNPCSQTITYTGPKRSV